MIEKIKVVILDADDTIAVRWGDEILPGRRKKLAQMQTQGKRIFIATNQGGPAYRIVYERAGNTLANIYPTLIQVINRLARVTSAIKAEECYIALHPGQGAIANELFMDLQMDAAAVHIFYKGMIHACWIKEWRKPRIGMIKAIMDKTKATQDEIMFVGNEITDFDTANKSGITYADTDEFFFGGEQ